MDPITYLTSPATDFTARAWVFFIAQIVLLGVGGYFGFAYQNANTARTAAMRRLGYALLVLGGLGTLFGVLRLSSVYPFTLPLWFYATLLLEVVLAVYAIYYGVTVYPQQVAAAAAASRRPLKRVPVPQQRLAAVQRNAAQPVANGNNTPIAPVSLSSPRGEGVASGRRDARRDRKKRNKR